MRDRLSPLIFGSRPIPVWIMAPLGIGILAIVPFTLGTFMLFVASLALAYAVASLGFSILIGGTGQVSLGHPIFFAIGAYACAVGAAHQINLLLGVLIGVGISVTLALLTGLLALRIAEFGLALVTLGLVLAATNYLSGAAWAGGTTGVFAPSISFFNSSRGISFNDYFPVAVLAVAAAYVVWCLNRSYLGRAFNGVRDMHEAAATCGIPSLRMKLAGFALSAVFASVAGAFFGGLIGSVDPTQFGFNLLLLFLAILIVGGRLSILGAFVGAAVFTFVPQELSGFQANENLFFGAAIMLTMLFAPDGLVSLGRPAIRFGFRLARRALPKGAPVPVAAVGEERPILEANLDRAVLVPVGPTLAEQQEPLDPEAGAAPLQPLGGAGANRLVVEGATKHFGGVPALADVSFTLGPSEILGLIGPNGSGKTTLLNCISRVFPLDKGRVLLEGDDITHLRADKIADRGLRRTFQHPHVVRNRTVLENVLVGCHEACRINPVLILAGGLIGAGRERKARERAMEALELVGLADQASSPIGSIQGPTLKLIEVARCLVAQPKVLLLDEVASGTNSYERAELAAQLLKINRALKMSMIVIEHDLEFVKLLVHRLMVLNVGNVVADGLPEMVLSTPEVMEAYIGV